MEEKGRSKSKLYKGVYWRKNIHGKIYWSAQCYINRRRVWASTITEREAAIKYDKIRIENGKEPVNILKRVN